MLSRDSLLNDNGTFCLNREAVLNISKIVKLLKIIIIYKFELIKKKVKKQKIRIKLVNNSILLYLNFFEIYNNEQRFSKNINV